MVKERGNTGKRGGGELVNKNIKIKSMKWYSMFLSFLEVAPHPVSIDIMGVEIGSVPDPDDAVIA